MKNFVICLVVILAVTRVKSAEIPEELKGLVAGVREKCHRETGVEIEHVDRTVEGYFHPTETLGCYFSCVFNTFELLDHDGHLDWDKVISRLGMVESLREHGMEMIAACKHVTGNNPCDSAFNIVQCFQKANPEKFFMV